MTDKIEEILTRLDTYIKSTKTPVIKLAESIGVNKSAIYKWRARERRLTATSYLKIQHFLDSHV